jgi:entericidin A
MTRYRLAAAALLAVLVLSACNTVRGFGKDVAKVGDEIEEAADEEIND